MRDLKALPKLSLRALFVAPSSATIPTTAALLITALSLKKTSEKSSILGFLLPPSARLATFVCMICIVYVGIGDSTGSICVGRSCELHGPFASPRSSDMLIVGWVLASVGFSS